MIRGLLLLLYNVLLIGVALEDVKFRKIRNTYTTGMVILAVCAIFVIPEITLWSRILGMFVISVPMGCVAIIRPGSFGGGDIKLTFACGAFLGMKLLVTGTVVAIFLAGSYCLCMICAKKVRGNVQFALGPFLSIGYIITAYKLL